MSGSLQISIQAKRGSLLRMKMVSDTVEPSDAVQDNMNKELLDALRLMKNGVIFFKASLIRATNRTIHLYR